MDTLKLGQSRIINFLAGLGGLSMGSRLRRWLQDPRKILAGANIAAGQTIVEVGCGPGFFTLDAAEMIGESGHLIAIEPLADFVETVKGKVKKAGLKNVEVLTRDALNTGLEDKSADLVLLFGVVPFPTLPLSNLLPEMHRILKTDGTLAVWLFPTTAGVPTAILKSGLFTQIGKKNGVYSYSLREQTA